MTIGIGAVCHGGNLIVMAADSRGSYSDSTLPAHDQIGKQYDLPFHFCVDIAGSIATCQSVVSFLHNEMEKLKEEPQVYHDHIRIAIRNAQLGELEFLYDYALMNIFGKCAVIRQIQGEKILFTFQ